MFPFYVHTQAVASTTWTAPHGLGATGLVIEVWDSSNRIIIPQSIEKTDANTTTITFSSAVSGSAVIVAVTGANSYTHTQGLAATTWTVLHALSDLDLIMTVYDNSVPSKVIIPNDMELNDVNTATLTFQSAVAGSVSIINAAGLQSYLHTEAVPADPWAITHNLNSRSNLVSLWDSGATRNRIYSDQYTQGTVNTATADWISAQDGFATIYSIFDNLPGVAGAASGVIANSAKPLRAMPGIIAR